MGNCRTVNSEDPSDQFRQVEDMNLLSLVVYSGSSGAKIRCLILNRGLRYPGRIGRS